MPLYYKKNEMPAELPESLVISRPHLVTRTVEVVTDENGVEETIEREETFTEMIDEVITPPYSSDDLDLLNYKLAPIKPEDTDFIEYKWDGSGWVAEDSDAAKLRTEKWAIIRRVRNNLLESSDKIVLSYLDEGLDVPQALKDDRQALRDFPKTHMTGEIDDWVDTLISIKNFPMYGTETLETE